MYNNDDNTIYLSLSKNNRIYFFLLNRAEGSIFKTFIANNFNRAYDTYLYDPQTLLVSARSSSDSSHYLYFYHKSILSSTVSKFIDTAITIRGISYSSISNRFILFGDVSD